MKFISLTEDEGRAILESYERAQEILGPKLQFLDEYHAAPTCSFCGGKVGYCECEEDK